VDPLPPFSAVNYYEKLILEHYMPPFDLNEIDAKIQAMKKTAQELAQAGENFPAIARNIVRISAGIRMLEINISDVVDLEKPDMPIDEGRMTKDE
jgi:hypothetical protein